ncbi:MAG: ABC transporter substrate-binding protein [Gammaproteobacteria bacterium]|nr:ABC transporter substrate-binding protein [Gammaproteobacteria bacterium]
MNNARWAASVLLAGLMACGGGGGGTHVDDNPVQPSPDTAKLGMLVPKTGVEAGNGVDIELGARLALQEINAAGGVNGQSLELLVRDDKNEAEFGPKGARELIAEGVVAIIGGATSRVTLPTAEQVTIPAGIPLISPAATSTRITALVDGDTVWRTVPSDALQGAVLAALIRREGLGRLAIIHVDDAYGQGLAQVLAEHFQAAGGQVLARVAYPSSKRLGFESEVAGLFAAGTPDALAIIGFTVDSAGITLALQQRGGVPRLFGVDGNFKAEFLTNAAPVIAGMQGTAPTAPRAAANYRHFAQAFQAAVGHAPDLFAESAYDAAYLAALAMAQGRSNSPGSLVAHLRAVSGPDTAQPAVVNPGEFAAGLSAIQAGRDIDYQGAGGAIDWDGFGDPASGTYLIWEVRGGAGTFRFEEREVIAFP